MNKCVYCLDKPCANRSKYCSNKCKRMANYYKSKPRRVASKIRADLLDLAGMVYDPQCAPAVGAEITELANGICKFIRDVEKGRVPDNRWVEALTDCLMQRSF